jgi:hypothetical protein
MHRPLVASGALLIGSAVLALSGCGSSNTTSSGAGTSAPTSAPTSAGANSGSAFCVQAAAAVAQLQHIGAGFAATTPGATPSVASIKQLFATADSAIDTLDSSAPSQISSAFHTLRAAYDQANSQVQAATTIEGLSGALSGLSSTSLTTADDQITAYLQTSCGISSPSP